MVATRRGDVMTSRLAAVAIGGSLLVAACSSDPSAGPVRPVDQGDVITAVSDAAVSDVAGELAITLSPQQRQRRPSDAPPVATAGAAPRSTAPVDPSRPADALPVPAPGSLRFVRLDDPALQPTQRGGRFVTLDVVGTFVIGGHDVSADSVPEPALWESADGGVWIRRALPVDDDGATVTASVRLGDRLLLFGDDPVAPQPVAWERSATGEISSIVAPSGDRAWSVVAAQPHRGGVLLWGQSDPPSGAPAVFAVAGPDGASWRQARALNALLAGHAAVRVVDVSTGAAGTAAVFETAGGDVLVLTDTGVGWTASVIDSTEATIAGVEVTSRVLLAGATLGRSRSEPAIFLQDSAGAWAPRPVEVLSDDRNAGFERSSGDVLHDSFLDGQVLTGNVATAEVLAVPAGGGTRLEAAYPDGVSGQGQPRIAQVAELGGVRLAIADDRPSVVRLDRFTVTPLDDGSFPGGESVPTASGPVVAGDDVVFGGAVVAVPAGPGVARRSWAQWTLDADGALHVAGAKGGQQLELADIDVGRSGALLGVGYEDFVPANFDDFIEPVEFVGVAGVLQPRLVGGGGRTVRFHQIADAGAAVVAAATVFDDGGRVDAAFFRRVGDGQWALAELPAPDRVEVASSAELVEMCPLPGGAIALARYEGGHRAYVTFDGASWQRFAPPELNAEGITVRGCAATADQAVVFGTLDGRARLWRTADGESYEAIAAPSDVGLLDATVDEVGAIWLLTPANEVHELAPDGRRTAIHRVPAEQLASPGGVGTLSELAVTPGRVVLLGTWNGGIGVWSAPR
jgi:hypothetical protein